MLGRWEFPTQRVGPRPSTFEAIFDVLNPRVLQAVRAGHEALDRLSVRHVLVGGLAVGVYGCVRVMKGVDFLVGPEAFEQSGVLVSFRPGVPLSAEGVPIDSILAPVEHEAVLGEAVADPRVVDGIPVIRPEALIYMKKGAWD